MQFGATLPATSIDTHEPDLLAARFAKESHVTQAFWSPSITE